MVVVCSDGSIAELKRISKYIALDSPQNAQMIREAIVDITIGLIENPEKYPLDKLKKNNNGTWRAFEKYHYRISYRILKDKIRIVRIRHTGKSPLMY